LDVSLQGTHKPELRWRVSSVGQEISEIYETRCSAAMKKLINQREAVVSEMIEGMLALDPNLVRLANLNVLLRADFAEVRDRQVALISGGGSGHEPAHAGYIGPGMLNAAIAGEIFTSPSVDSIWAAIKAVAGKPGVLLIVKNYTGDRLNFSLAAEMARAEGIAVRMVIVADDVALLERPQDGEKRTAGARGLAGTVLIHKIAGACAAEGRSLDEVSEAAGAAIATIGTMGLGLSAGTSPMLGQPSFVLGENELELGLGIHGEPGVRRVPLASADRLTDTLIETIVSARDLHRGDRLAVLVNDLGSTTPMELDIVARHAFDALRSHGLIVERMYSGAMLTSLDMAGISITLLAVDDERLRFLDAATSAPAWPNFPRRPPAPLADRVLGADSVWPAPGLAPISSDVTAQRALQPVQPIGSTQGIRTEQAIRSACVALLDAEPVLTPMDKAVGDGDLGINLARGASAVEGMLSHYPLDDPAATLISIGRTLQQTIGGSSGPFYGVLFIRGGNALRGRNLKDPAEWGFALSEACDAISELGGAKRGDRTMLDALLPFAETLRSESARGAPAADALKAAAAAAARGAEQTATMRPRAGRSSYLGERALGHPDPGAIAASIWLHAVVRAC
jgi:triose/dihydroxyacetone kinase / FAD-AMP lyase (cyclizing)